VTPHFSYTIGLFHSHAYPELIVFGLKPDSAHAIFNIVAKAAARGSPIPLDRACSDLLESYDCVFLEVPRALYGEFVLSAIWFHEGTDFPLYQVVWPSQQGHYPWHPKAAEEFRELQPVLGHNE